MNNQSEHCLGGEPALICIFCGAGARLTGR